MNTPNKLTVVRVALVPIFLIFVFIDSIPGHFLWAFFVFVLASITDFFDGYLARKHDLVTDFGKFMDPLADKVLVISALIALVQLQVISAIVVILIITREFMVTSIRLIAAGKGKVIAADIFGKLKTVSSILTISLILLVLGCVELQVISSIGIWMVVINICVWIMTFLTILSGINYVWQNKDFIKTAQ